mgnify:CR=1 FL=1
MAVWGDWVGKSSTRKMRLGMDLWYTGDPSNGYVTVHKIVYAECYYRIADTSNNSNVSGVAGSYSGSLSYNFPSNYSVIAVWGEGTQVVWLQQGATTYVDAAASVSGIDYIGSTYVAQVYAGLTLPALAIPTPAAPTIGSNTRNSDTQNTVTWTNNPTQQAPYTYLYVERSTDGGSFAQVAQLAGTATSFVDTTTSADHYYSYRVRAWNSSGYGPYSAVSSTTYNTPSAVVSVTASWSAPTQATVTWVDASLTATGFEVERSTDGGTTWSNRASLGDVTSYIDTVAPGTTVIYRVQATRGALAAAYSPSSSPLSIPVGVSFSKEHTAVRTGQIVKVSYDIGYYSPPPFHANVKVYHGTTSGELVSDTTHEPGVDLVLNHLVTIGDKFTVVVTTCQPIVDNAWTIDFYEAVDDNTWTFLGHADDKLVGMTANSQLWTGDPDSFTLSNAVVLDPPTDLAIGDISAVGNLTVSATQTTNEPFRISVCHTVVNKYGPTLPSAPFTFYASKPTIEWTPAAFVTVSSTVENGVGIEAVELYFVEDEYQEFAFLGRVLTPEIGGTTPPSTKPWSFNWTGYQTDVASWTIANLTLPTENYTGGVPATKMVAIDGRLYFWGGDPAYRIWIGGNPGNRFSVSPGTGGGFVDVDPGTGAIVKSVLKFKTQQGASIVTALCDHANSQREHRYNLVETNISLTNEQSKSTWQAEKVAGTVGCKSFNGAVAAADGLYAISRYGLALTTLTMEYNSQIQIAYVSDAIEPVFLKQYGNQLEDAVLFEINGVLYMTFGRGDSTLDNVIFCYDISMKAWWTYTLPIDAPVLNMFPIDYEGRQEGIGIVTSDAVYLLPTTVDAGLMVPDHSIMIESGELSTTIPLSSMHYLAQLELRFDYFIGDLETIVTMIDQFGREITSRKLISYDTVQHQLAEHIRIDQTVESYKIMLTGQARMRLTHIIAKVYPKSQRIGMVYGFDSRQSHSAPGSIHHTFASYNDLKKAIIP